MTDLEKLFIFWLIIITICIIIIALDINRIYNLLEVKV